MKKIEIQSFNFRISVLLHRIINGLSSSSEYLVSFKVEGPITSTIILRYHLLLTVNENPISHISVPNGINNAYFELPSASTIERVLSWLRPIVQMNSSTRGKIELMLSINGYPLISAFRRNVKPETFIIHRLTIFLAVERERIVIWSFLSLLERLRRRGDSLCHKCLPLRIGHCGFACHY